MGALIAKATMKVTKTTICTEDAAPGRVEARVSRRNNVEAPSAARDALAHRKRIPPSMTRPPNSE